MNKRLLAFLHKWSIWESHLRSSCNQIPRTLADETNDKDLVTILRSRCGGGFLIKHINSLALSRVQFQLVGFWPFQKVIKIRSRWELYSNNRPRVLFTHQSPSYSCDEWWTRCYIPCVHQTCSVGTDHWYGYGYEAMGMVTGTGSRPRGHVRVRVWNHGYGYGYGYDMWQSQGTGTRPWVWVWVWVRVQYVTKLWVQVRVRVRVRGHS